MEIRLLQIDAFAGELFSGNPAAVMPLPHWLDDTTLQKIARENNLSETAFYVAQLPEGVTAPQDSLHDPSVDAPAYHLRWFTPAIEVDLCGHATLATAAHLFEDVHPDATTLQLLTRSGWLIVRRGGCGSGDEDGNGSGNGHGGAIVMDFPAEQLTPIQPDPANERALGASATAAFRGTDLV